MWYQLKIEHCLGEKAEEIGEYLEARGALSIMMTDNQDNPVLEPEPGSTPLWPQVIIQALYASAVEAEEARVDLRQSHPDLQLSLDVLPDKDWERVCMDDFKPQRFGKGLWVCPSWSEIPDPKAVHVILDPGLAFGTGTHPTTSLCLTWLEQADLKDKSLIDYGCGSGILALAALKLGAKRVFAADIDQQALQATQSNALANRITEEELIVLLPEALQDPADVILANILLDPLISLKNRFNDLLKVKGTLVVSGLLAAQAPVLISTYAPVFQCIHQETQDDWSLLVFTKGQA